MLCHLVQKLSQAQPGGCGYGDGIPDAQVIEFIYIVSELFKAVHLIDRQHHRLSGLSQHVRHLGIGIHQALTHVHDENDHIGRIDGDLGLLPHLGQDDVAGIRLDPAGVDQRKGVAQPGAVCVDPVPGHSRGIFYNGNGTAGQHVEQRGFSHVGAANNGYDWFAHIDLLFMDGFSTKGPLPLRKGSSPSWTARTCRAPWSAPRQPPGPGWLKADHIRLILLYL